MENAAKALLMAGAILIGITLISIGVYFFSSSAKVAITYGESLSAAEIQEFNGQFEVYLGRDDLIIHDVISVANLARDYNLRYDLTKENKTFYVEVILDKQNIDQNSDRENNGLIENEMFIDQINYDLQKYKCTKMEYNKQSSKIYKIEFEKYNPI